MLYVWQWIIINIQQKQASGRFWCIDNEMIKKSVVRLLFQFPQGQRVQRVRLVHWNHVVGDKGNNLTHSTTVIGLASGLPQSREQLFLHPQYMFHHLLSVRVEPASCWSIHQYRQYTLLRSLLPVTLVSLNCSSCSVCSLNGLITRGLWFNSDLNMHLNW